MLTSGGFSLTAPLFSGCFGAPDKSLTGGATGKHWAWMNDRFATLDAWKRKIAQLRAAGIEAVLIGGSPEFYREHIPAAKEEGVEVHAWMFTMMRGGLEQEHPEWYAVNRNGVSTAEKPPYVGYYKFLCPSRDDVQAHILDHICELLLVDGLASIHLDYIRYPDVILPVALWPKYNLIQDKEYPDFDYCYCPVCREKFKNATGIDPVDLSDPSANEAWVQYRCDSITQVVNRIAAEVHANGSQLTAAVFPTPTIARSLVRQEWAHWDLDAVFPMVYHSFYEENVDWIETAVYEGVEALAGRIPLFAGLFVPDLPPPELARAAELAIRAGASGISLFEGNTPSQEHWDAVSSVIKRT